MDEILHLRPEDVPAERVDEHEGFAYRKRALVPRGAAGCVAAVYEIPPGKAAYPYHYHVMNEECFYILSGSGVLRCPQGDRFVQAGEFLFFPASAKGAHQLVNISASEDLVYLDVDTSHDPDVAIYPDSGKIAVWGKGIDQVFCREDAVEYYYKE